MNLIKAVGIGSVTVAIIIGVFYNILPVYSLFVIPVVIIIPPLIDVLLDIIFGKIHYFIILDHDNNEVSQIFAKRTKKQNIKINDNLYTVDLSKRYHVFIEGYAQELKFNSDKSKLIPSKELSVIIRSNVLEKLFTSDIDKYVMYILLLCVGNIIFSFGIFLIMNSNFQKIITLMGG